MPTHRKNLYELTEYPATLKKRGNPVVTTPVARFVLISRRHFTYDNQGFDEDADSSRSDSQICQIKGRPESQANIVADAALNRAFDGMAQRTAENQTCKDPKGWDPSADDDQWNGGRHPQAQ